MRIRFGVVVGLLLIALPRVAGAQPQDEVFYYHLDAIGSVRAITDPNGQLVELRDFLPFGEPWPPSAPNSDPRQFTGQEHDIATGFDYFGARHYASLNGRFTGADDPGYANPFDPQSLNLYAYAYNNPLRFVDSTGHDGDCVYQYDPGKGHCYIDAGTMQFLFDLGRPISTAALSIRNFVVAPRDPGCITRSIALGGSLGGVAGGVILGAGGGVAGGVGGTAVLPGGGTLGGAVLGAGVGYAQGTLVGSSTGAMIGGVVGSVACMGSASGGGGGGGGDNKGQNRAFREAVRRIERATGKTLDKDQIRQLHDEITKLGLTLEEIVDVGIALFGGK